MTMTGISGSSGRDDDVIKSSGYRIGPFEVESALLEHPAVQEAAVVGSPDRIRGMIVKAFVVLNTGYDPSESLVREIKTYVKRTTAPYKYPARNRVRCGTSQDHLRQDQAERSPGCRTEKIPGPEITSFFCCTDLWCIPIFTPE